MKIVCDSCQAKYSIADEKVVGKVFKIRCKRCGNTIVVRTDEQGAAGGGGGTAAGGEAIWHVVVNGEQHGPYDPAQLGEMLTAGTVDWEAYVWCEGFENWMPMRDVEDLVAQITGQGQPAQQAQAAPRASAMNYSTPPSMGADPFADDAQSGSSPFDAPDAGPDLFGPSAQSGRYDKPAAPAAAAAPIPSAADQPMTGVRNENSVLFSLKNLQALATGSSPSNPPPAAQPGFATGEGSGLIDIRALATATGVGAGDGGGEKDDLLSMGAHQGGAFGALGSPMLAPVADDGDGNRKTLILAGVAATAFLSVAAIAIVYILRPQSAPAPQAVVAVPTPTAPAAAVPAAAPAPGQPAPAPGAAPAQPPSEGELAAQKAAAAAAAPTPPSGEGAKKKRPAGAAGATKSAGDDDDLLAPSKEDAKPSAPKGPRTIDDLLDTALEGKSAAKPAGGGAAPSSLPEAPGRDEVKRALDSVKGGVQGCAQGQGGVAIVEVTVAGSTGRVTNATVEGITGPAGSCIAREVRKASFPKFKNATFKVKYPYRL